MNWNGGKIPSSNYTYTSERFGPEAARIGAPQAVQIADRFHLSVRRIGAYSIPFRERKG
jgi:hypothetical protein